MKRVFLTYGFLVAVVAAGPLTAPCAAQGFNLFTVQQDVDLGRQSAIEAERQLTLLNDASVDRYLNQIIQKLAAVAPGARYPYLIKAVNAAEINAFALPGGPMYVNRGLLAAARNEAELAGVLAHEMSHVALRHGTNQASKAYLGQAGLSILGGLLGKNGGSAASIVNAIGGVGMNAVFLKFSRDDEYEADASGARIMAKAGYDPIAMANFFELLRAEQGRDPGKLEQFFSDHPPAADREARIRQLAASLGTVRTQQVGGFDGIRAAAARTAVASSTPIRSTVPPVTANNPPGGRLDVRVAAPSSRFVTFRPASGFFTIQHPDNWLAYGGSSGLAVTFAPRGGIVDQSNGQQAILYGVIVNHYAPFEGQTDRVAASLQHHYAPFEANNSQRGTLEDATDDLVRQILRSNSYLRAEDGSARPERIAGSPAYSVMLAGISPATGEEERVTVFTRRLPDAHVIYALCIVPARDFDGFNRACTTMVRTLTVNDAAAHRTAATTRLRSNSRGRSKP